MNAVYPDKILIGATIKSPDWESDLSCKGKQDRGSTASTSMCVPSWHAANTLYARVQSIVTQVQFRVQCPVKGTSLFRIEFGKPNIKSLIKYRQHSPPIFNNRSGGSTDLGANRLLSISYSYCKTHLGQALHLGRTARATGRLVDSTRS